jgi:hypothetical protein
MESPRRRFDRLVGVLEDLVTSEADTVRAGDFGALADLQERTGCVVDALVGMEPSLADARARARVASVLSRRQHTIELLESQLAVAREELNALEASTQRVARVAPVYGRPAMERVPQRFKAVG